NGNVHVEDPAPAEVVGEIPADGRSDHRGNPEDAAEDSLKLRAFRGRIQVTDRREHAREEHAAEDSLNAAEGDELRHVLRLPAERGRENETDHSAEKEWLAAEQVAQLAGDRGERGRGDEVGGRDPREVIEAIQVGDDAREGRADDRLVKGREEERE